MIITMLVFIITLTKCYILGFFPNILNELKSMDEQQINSLLNSRNATVNNVFSS